MPRSGSPLTGASGDSTDPSMTADAVYAARQTVAELTRLRGPNHPETLRNRAELARRRHKAGDLQGAVRDYEKLLKDLVRALGREHAGTLDVGTAPAAEHVEADGNHGAITDYERRAQDLLNRLGATYSPLL